MIQAIAHPTDFSEASADAFAHALRLAVEFKCRLDLLHVKDPSGKEAWEAFPGIRETLAQWGLLPADAPRDAITEQLGVTVRKIEVRHQDAIGGIVTFLLSHRPDLIVLATHGPTGLTRWISGSVSEAVAREAHMPTLFLGPDTQPFVDPQSGALKLNTLVLPVARDPSPRRALHTLRVLLGQIAPRMHAFHIGDTSPWILDETGTPLDVAVMKGPVVETILEAAKAHEADLIVMPTAGHNGFLDALRGSTTEQVLRQAPCPVLALPA